MITDLTLMLNTWPHARMGSLAFPMFPHVATPVDRVWDLFCGPEVTTEGVVCAGCSVWLDGARFQARHASVAHVRECASICEYQRRESDAELAAERACERFYEEGLYGPEDDPRERALRALEDERRGR
jgi:hypothetical protein